MRSRNIKPGFFENEILGSIDPLAQILFAGLWCLSDREGRLEDRPARIKAQIFPYRQANTDKLLALLAQSGFIIRYEIEGQKFICIPKFKEHQKPHPHEAKSKLPDISMSLHVMSCDTNVSKCNADIRIEDIMNEDSNSKTLHKTEYPEWLPIEAWEGFVEMRNKIKEPLTARAVKLAFSTLEKLMANGENAEAVLNQSTFNNYRGLFPVKNKNTELRTPKITTLEDMLKEAQSANNAQ